MELNYHKDVPNQFKLDLEKLISSEEPITVRHLDKIMGEIVEPIGSILLQALTEVTSDKFVDKDRPNWKAIGKFKKKYGLTWIKGIRLPFQPESILRINEAQALRAVCTKSPGYKALIEDFMLLSIAKRNGLGASPYICVLYFFDKLLEKVKSR